MKVYESYLGKKYCIDEAPFDSGGEGTVYEAYNFNNTIVKVYTPSKRNAHQEKKLKSMLDAKLDEEIVKQFAWPKDIIYDKGDFVGFVMNKIHGVKLNLIYSEKYSDMPLSKKITIAKNLCVAVHNLHQTGNVIGDMNPNNILVSPETGLVYLIDCDSFHIIDSKHRTYRCEVAMPDYIAPSVSNRLAKGESLKTAHLPTFTTESDNFSLAVHIFQLLMNGAHPFTIAINRAKNKMSIALPQPSENMKNRVFPYDKCPEGYKLPIYALSFDVLSKKLRALFVKCFSNNEDVEPQTWFAALCEYEELLKICRVNHNHEFRKGLHKCPYCSATTNTAKMLATGTMPKASLTKDGTKKSHHFERLLFWIVTLVLAFEWQLAGCYIVGLENQFIDEVASFMGISYQGFTVELLNINCACGIAAAVLYNCITRRKEIKLKNYFLSQLFAVLGFVLGFVLCSVFQ